MKHKIDKELRCEICGIELEEFGIEMYLVKHEGKIIGHAIYNGKEVGILAGGGEIAECDKLMIQDILE